MKLILLSCALLIPQFSFSQTCIILVAYNDTITIGADSRNAIPGRLIYRDGRIKYTVHYQQMCKIRSEGQVYYTGAGHAMDIIMKYAKQALLNGGPINDSIKYPFKSALKELEDNIEIVRKKSKKVYENYRESFARIIFFWFENKIPKGFGLIFRTANKDSQRTIIKMQSSLFNFHVPDRRIVLSLGHDEAIEKYLFGSTTFWEKQPTKDGIKKLLEMQIAATPADVGYPISILQVTYNKIKWINKGVCK